MKNNNCVQRMVAKEVRMFHKGKLRSGSGKKVKNVKQALAIGYAQGRSKCSKGGRKRRKKY